MELQFADPSARGLATTIEAAIRTRILAPGEAVPSVREMAASAGVSTATAAAALTTLRRRGLIVTRERRRSVVSIRPPLALVTLATGTVGVGVRDLSSGNPDAELLPDLRAPLARLHVDHRSYDDEPVIPELIELARADLAESGVEAGGIALASGAFDAVERVLNAHLGPGDVVAVEDPCYSPTIDLIRAMGLVPLPIPIDDRGPLAPGLTKAIAAGAAAVVVTPRAQNPTGAAFDGERARELRRVLARNPGLLVVEDDHQGPIAGVDGYSIAPGQRRWARVRSLAKALGPDIRLALIGGDEETLSRVQGRHAVGPGWVSEILQRLVVELMRQKRVRAGLVRATRIYSERRQGLIEELGRHGIAAIGRSGFNVWIPVPDEATVVAALLERRWSVAPGAPYRLESPPAIRVTTAALTRRDAEAFAADLAAVLAPKRRRRAA